MHFPIPIITSSWSGMEIGLCRHSAGNHGSQEAAEEEGGGDRQRVETGIQLNSIVAIFVKIKQFSLVHHVRTRI